MSSVQRTGDCQDNKNTQAKVGWTHRQNGGRVAYEICFLPETNGQQKKQMTPKQIQRPNRGGPQKTEHKKLERQGMQQGGMESTLGAVQDPRRVVEPRLMIDDDVV